MKHSVLFATNKLRRSAQLQFVKFSIEPKS